MCNSSRVSYFWSGAPLVRRGIKQSHFAALLDFPNVIRPNESNPESETSHFAGVWMHVSDLKKVFLDPMASCDGVIPLFGHISRGPG